MLRSWAGGDYFRVGGANQIIRRNLHKSKHLTATHQPQPNKALHPTAYSYARRASSLRFRRRVSLVFGLDAGCGYMIQGSKCTSLFLLRRCRSESWCATSTQRFEGTSTITGSGRGRSLSSTQRKI